MSASTSSAPSTAAGATSTAPPAPFTPVPIPSSGGPGPSQSGPPNNVPQSNAFPQSTASNLYLYTFLATLVLLLLVSGAVILRSMTLRVRARRALEEAIRNGTYVPPSRFSPGGSAAGAAPEPPPCLFDAHVKDLERGYGYGSGDPEEEKQEKENSWVRLKPLAAAFIPSPSPFPSPSPAPAPAQPAPWTWRRPLRALHIRDVLDALAARDLHARLAHAHARGPSQAQLAAAAFAPREGTGAGAGTGAGNGEGGEGGSAPETTTVPRPAAVRVAVLVAMPDPARPAYAREASEKGEKRGSTASGGGGAEKGNDSEKEGEEDVPYVEFGVAEVPLGGAPPVPASENGEGAGGGELKNGC
ncbi:hypothetical protein DFH11DRAFT_1615953 [Phellopilus nigrolimitatus]|nr:hypothetical protein DFH11DRAFT_1615953 [Phellopilus nigrolimitatus]